MGKASRLRAEREKERRLNRLIEIGVISDVGARDPKDVGVIEGIPIVGNTGPLWIQHNGVAYKISDDYDSSLFFRI